MNPLQKTKDRLLNASCLDYRSIALFRIALGLYLVFDTTARLLQVENFYSIKGVFGKAFIFGLYGDTIQTAFRYLDTDFAVYAFLAFSLAVFVAYTLGVKTRWVSILAFACLLSIHDRNLFVRYGADVIAEVFLFWSIFLPLDKIRNPFVALAPGQPLQKGARAPLFQYKGLPAFIILFQIGWMYFTTTFTKSGEEWTQGYAILNVLSDTMRRRLPFADWMLQAPALGVLFNYATLAVEFAILFLIFSPVQNARMRMVAALLIIGLHWGIHLFFEVGNFRYVTLSLAFLLLPGEFWQWLGKRVKMRQLADADKLKADLPPSKFGQCGKYARNVLLAFVCLGASCGWIKIQGKYNTIFAPYVQNRLTDNILELYRKHIGHWALFNQQWTFFSPGVSDQVGWLVVGGQLPDGSVINLYTGKSVKEDEPRNYFGGLWSIFASTVRSGPADEPQVQVLPAWARWEAGRWQAQHPGQPLEKVVILVHSIFFDKNTPSVLKDEQKYALAYELDLTGD